MIISDDDIATVHSLLERITAYSRIPEDDVREMDLPQDPIVLAQRPHLLMALGFDEFRSFEPFSGSRSNHYPFVVQQYGLAQYDPAFALETVYRRRKGGAWYWYEGIGDDTVHFVGPPEDHHRHIPIDEWLDALKALHARPDPLARRLWLPTLWTSPAQEQQRAAIGSVAAALIGSIQSQETDLRAIPWRHLEEMVAELLRSRGLQIHVTPRTADGGRDIIARGELIPGEPTVLAVEVKQKAVVGIADVQRALRANEDFPMLMIATAGRFSAGVIAERDRCRNRMRLFLKDGVAIGQWIESYTRRLATR